MLLHAVAAIATRTIARGTRIKMHVRPFIGIYQWIRTWLYFVMPRRRTRIYTYILILWLWYVVRFGIFFFLFSLLIFIFAISFTVQAMTCGFLNVCVGNRGRGQRWKSEMSIWKKNKKNEKKEIIMSSDVHWATAHQWQQIDTVRYRSFLPSDNWMANKSEAVRSLIIIICSLAVGKFFYGFPKPRLACGYVSVTWAHAEVNRFSSFPVQIVQIGLLPSFSISRKL